MQSGDYSRDTRRLEPTRTKGIFRRGNRYIVVFRDPSGRQRKKFARTEKEARELKAALNADVARGEYRELSKITFAEYAPEWIDSYQGRTSRGIREETRKDYRARLERDAIPFFGRMRLSAIEPRHIKEFATHVASRGVRKNTVRLALAPVKALLATALEEGLIRTSPTAGVRINVPEPTAGEAEADVKSLTEEELTRLISKLPPKHRLFFSFLAQTGLRISEAIALELGDLDLGRRRVRVRRRIYRGTVAPPKSRYGSRDVPITQAMAQELWELRKSRGNLAESDPLFESPAGGRIDGSNLMSRVLKPAARTAGLEWAGFHTFRHTAATRLFRQGWNAKQVQLVLGHHSPAFTLETYVHLLPDDLPEPVFANSAASVNSGSDASRDEPDNGNPVLALEVAASASPPAV